MRFIVSIACLRAANDKNIDALSRFAIITGGDERRDHAIFASRPELLQSASDGVDLAI